MEKGKPFCTVSANADWCSHCGKQYGDTKKLKMDLPLDPVIPLLGIYPKEPKTLIWKNISTPMFIAALFTIAKIWIIILAEWWVSTVLVSLRSCVFGNFYNKKKINITHLWLSLSLRVKVKISPDGPPPIFLSDCIFYCSSNCSFPCSPSAA